MGHEPRHRAIQKYWYDFSGEFLKQAIANKGQISKIDWHDVATNTITKKFGIMGQAGVKTWNSFFDFSGSKGVRVAGYNKTWIEVNLDGTFNFLKLGFGQLGPNPYEKAIMEGALDQIKGGYKELN